MSACGPASSVPGTEATAVQQQESDAGAVVREALGSTRVVILGTGTPTADPERSGPCVAIVVNGTPYLVDLGPGVIRRAAAAVQAGVFELDPINLRHAFITHLHSDHTVGYPDLIFSPWALGRDWSIDVWGPTGIAAMTEHLMAARPRSQSGSSSDSPTSSRASSLFASGFHAADSPRSLLASDSAARPQLPAKCHELLFDHLQPFRDPGPFTPCCFP